jgi:hypothetical protein
MISGKKIPPAVTLGIAIVNKDNNKITEPLTKSSFAITRNRVTNDMPGVREFCYYPYLWFLMALSTIFQLYRGDVNSFQITQILKYFTTEVVSSNPVHGEVYSIQHYVMKFVGVLWQEQHDTFRIAFIVMVCYITILPTKAKLGKTATSRDYLACN